MDSMHQALAWARGSRIARANGSPSSIVDASTPLHHEAHGLPPSERTPAGRRRAHLAIAVGAAGSASVRRAETEPLDRTRSEVVDEHVRPGEEGVEQRTVRGRLDVQRRAALAAIQPDEIGRLPLHYRVVVAGEVSAVRPLDLHHVRTEIGEVPGRARRGEDGRHVHDPQAVECLHRNGRRYRYQVSVKQRWPSSPSAYARYSPWNIGRVRSLHSSAAGAEMRLTIWV